MEKIKSLFKERENLYFEVKNKLSHLKSIEEEIIYLFLFEVCHVDIIKWFLKYDMSIEDFEKTYKTITTNTQDPVAIINNFNKNYI